MSARLVPPLDDRDAWTATGWCPVERAWGVVGSRCSMLIMREAYYGTTRFDEFLQRVDVAPATLTSHLSGLVQAGLLERHAYRDPGQRAREEYRLTEAGMDLLPAVVALFQWGRKHGGAPVTIDTRHEGCGGAVTAEVRCGNGHPVPLAEIEVRRVPRSRV